METEQWLVTVWLGLGWLSASSRQLAVRVVGEDGGWVRRRSGRWVVPLSLFSVALSPFSLVFSATCLSFWSHGILDIELPDTILLVRFLLLVASHHCSDSPVCS